MDNKTKNGGSATLFAKCAAVGLCSSLGLMAVFGGLVVSGVASEGLTAFFAELSAAVGVFVSSALNIRKAKQNKGVWAFAQAAAAFAVYFVFGLAVSYPPSAARVAVTLLICAFGALGAFFALTKKKHHKRRK